MKYLALIGLFVAGCVVGYFVGSSKTFFLNDETADSTEYITDFSEDEVPDDKNHKSGEKKIVTNNIGDSLALVDSLSEIEFEDSLLNFEAVDDTSDVEDEELNIKRDRMISSIRVPIIYLEEEVEKDSVIKELLGIKENKPKEMILQFWESPLGYSGYKLSRNTLVLYGLSEQFKYTIYFKENYHYLSTKELFYILRETSDFVPFKTANRNAILND